MAPAKSAFVILGRSKERSYAALSPRIDEREGLRLLAADVEPQSNSNFAITGTWSDGFSQPRAACRIS